MTKSIKIHAQVSHGQTNRPNEHTDEGGRFTRIRIEDASSHTLIMEIALSPTEFGRLLAGHDLETDADVWPERAARWGRVHRMRSVTVGPAPYGMYSQRDETMRQAATPVIDQLRTEGWEEFSVSRNNAGIVSVIARRFDEPQANTE